jgi:N-acyl amino acid synthase of PEP-CTERM/exosortase system
MLNKRYEVILADTDESKKDHFNLRYQVYCVEKGFEEPEKFADNQEIDEYDDNAVHFLVRCRLTNRYVGTFRLVIDKLSRLPVHEHATIDPAHLSDPDTLAAEFSRLTILRPFQNLQTKTEQELVDSDCCILTSAVYAGIEYARKKGATNLVFLCRRSLPRVVAKLGLNILRIGPASEHRGIRYPYRIPLEYSLQRTFENASAERVFFKNNSWLKHSECYHAEQESLAA